jgi:hypothetical protein
MILKSKVKSPMVISIISNRSLEFVLQLESDNCSLFSRNISTDQIEPGMDVLLPIELWSLFSQSNPFPLRLNFVRGLILELVQNSCTQYRVQVGVFDDIFVVNKDWLKTNCILQLTNSQMNEVNKTQFEETVDASQRAVFQKLVIKNPRASKGQGRQLRSKQARVSRINPTPVTGDNDTDEDPDEECERDPDPLADPDEDDDPTLTLTLTLTLPLLLTLLLTLTLP